MSVGSDAADRAEHPGEPVAPGSEVEREWEAVRKRCGLLDAKIRGLLRLTGPDRIAFLQGMLTNDLRPIAAGQGTYAALLTIQGHVVADLRVYVLPEEVWLDVPAGCRASVQAALERYIIADDVEFIAGSEWAPLVALEGPQATRVLVAVMADALDGVPLFGHREVSFDGHPVRVAVANHTGETGYVVFGDRRIFEPLWAHCCAAGAEPVGPAALDVLRVEAGIPSYGRDMDESTLVSEVGLESAVSFRKGCYLGQEVVERVAARGQVQRKLVGLVCTGSAVPPAGTPLIHAAKPAGAITSAVWSPACAAVVALGFTRRDACEIGTELQVGLPELPVARVVPLPFYVQSARPDGP